MPRYFFHLQDSREYLDREGTELPGPEEARSLAVVHSGEILTDSGSKFWEHDEWRLWVTDEADATVCALRLTAEK